NSSAGGVGRGTEMAGTRDAIHPMGGRHVDPAHVRGPVLHRGWVEDDRDRRGVDSVDARVLRSGRQAQIPRPSPTRSGRRPRRTAVSLPAPDRPSITLSPNVDAGTLDLGGRPVPHVTA